MTVKSTKSLWECCSVFLCWDAVAVDKFVWPLKIWLVECETATRVVCLPTCTPWGLFHKASTPNNPGIFPSLWLWVKLTKRSPTRLVNSFYGTGPGSLKRLFQYLQNIFILLQCLKSKRLYIILKYCIYLYTIHIYNTNTKNIVSYHKHK